MTAFVTWRSTQAAGHDIVARSPSAESQGLEAFTIAGAGSLMARIVTHSKTEPCSRVIDLVLADTAILGRPIRVPDA